MNIETHNINDKKIAEIITDEIILKTTEDGLDLLGDILQKFTQYQMPLTIVGDFSKFNSKSLNDFIYESNKGRQVNFVASQSEALKVLSK